MNAQANQKPAGYTACCTIYVLYMIAPFAYGIIPWVAGLLIAFVSESEAAPEIAEHLDYAKRLGITGLIGGFVVVVIAVIGIMLYLFTKSSLSFVIGSLPVLTLWIWSLVKSIRGLEALTNGVDPPSLGSSDLSVVFSQIREASRKLFL